VIPACAHAASTDVGERIIHRAGLGLALVLVKIRLKLLLGFFAVEQEFLPRAERQAAYIAVGDTGSGPNKSCDLKVPFCHCRIVSN